MSLEPESLKNAGDGTSGHRSQIGEVPTGRIWNDWSIKIIMTVMNDNPLNTLETMSPFRCQLSFVKNRM